MRLPWTIWIHTLADLWKQVLLITVVLTTVIAFGFSVKFLAEGKLGPLMTLKFIGFAFIPMLQYSLPFAAAFGATLVYHRMSQDNETAAAHAGGIGHRALLVPAIATGLLMAVVLLGLTQSVIPRFMRQMQSLISLDAARLIAGTIEEGRPLVHDRWMMLADSVRRLGPHRASGAYEHLLLTGVVFVELDADGTIARDGFAGTGKLYFFDQSDGDPATEQASRRGALFGDDRAGSGLTLVRVELEQGMIRPRGGMFAQVESAPLFLRIPGALQDDPKFLTYSELREVPNNPDRMSMIEQRRRDLAVHLAERIANDEMKRALQARQPIELKDAAGRTFSIRAGAMRWVQGENAWRLEPAGGQASVDIRIQGRPGTQQGDAMQRRTVMLAPDLGKDRAARELTYTLDLTETADHDGSRGLEQVYAKLVPASAAIDEVLGKSSRDLLAMAGERAKSEGPNPTFAAPAEDLRKRLARLMREVFSKQHERIALSVSCLVMVATGAVSAMRLGSALPLAVYLWSFFPALLAIITIATGQQITHHQGYAGLLILWGGVAGLSGYTYRALALVRRH